MISSFSYSRVSSREQEREGYSIPSQRKLLSGYARALGFCIDMREQDLSDRLT